MAIIAELDGLQNAITSAVEGAISRPVVVRNRDVDGFWGAIPEQTYPLITIRLKLFTLVRLAGGGGAGTKGQQSNHQNVYTVEIRDVVDPREGIGERVGSAQTDAYLLVDAIVAYLDVVANQSLGGAATKAGEAIRFAVARPFAQVDGGEVNVFLAGDIAVIGIPHKQIVS